MPVGSRGSTVAIVREPKAQEKAPKEVRPLHGERSYSRHQTRLYHNSAKPAGWERARCHTPTMNQRKLFRGVLLAGCFVAVVLGVLFSFLPSGDRYEAAGGQLLMDIRMKTSVGSCRVYRFPSMEVIESRLGKRDPLGNGYLGMADYAVEINGQPMRGHGNATVIAAESVRFNKKDHPDRRGLSLWSIR